MVKILKEVKRHRKTKLQCCLVVSLIVFRSTKTAKQAFGFTFSFYFWVARMDITVSVQIMWKVALLGILACKSLMFRKKTSNRTKPSSHLKNRKLNVFCSKFRSLSSICSCLSCICCNLTHRNNGTTASNRCWLLSKAGGRFRPT